MEIERETNKTFFTKIIRKSLSWFEKGHRLVPTCVDAQWIEVLHVADGDTVISNVSYHLVFHLFPAKQRLFHEDLIAHGQSLRYINSLNNLDVCFTTIIKLKRKEINTYILKFK